MTRGALRCQPRSTGGVRLLWGKCLKTTPGIGCGKSASRRHLVPAVWPAVVTSTEATCHQRSTGSQGRYGGHTRNRLPGPSRRARARQARTEAPPKKHRLSGSLRRSSTRPFIQASRGGSGQLLGSGSSTLRMQFMKRHMRYAEMARATGSCTLVKPSAACAAGSGTLAPLAPARLRHWHFGGTVGCVRRASGSSSAVLLAVLRRWCARAHKCDRQLAAGAHPNDDDDASVWHDGLGARRRRVRRNVRRRRVQQRRLPRLEPPPLGHGLGAAAEVAPKETRGVCRPPRRLLCRLLVQPVHLLLVAIITVGPPCLAPACPC